MAAKLTRLTHKNSDTTASSDRELYHLQFSLQAASSETFGYTSRIKEICNDVFNVVATVKCPHGQFRWRWGACRLACLLWLCTVTLQSVCVVICPRKRIHSLRISISGNRLKNSVCRWAR
jgi:hypothetical protein